jgi:hypothetical protein
MAIEACRTLGGFVRLSRVMDRHPADIELLMREVHRFSDDDYDNDNDNDNGQRQREGQWLCALFNLVLTRN